MHCQACMYAAQQQDANVSLQFCTMCSFLLVLLALVLLNRPCGHISYTDCMSICSALLLMYCSPRQLAARVSTLPNFCSCRTLRCPHLIAEGQLLEAILHHIIHVHWVLHHNICTGV